MADFESGSPLLLEGRSDFCEYVGIDSFSSHTVSCVWRKLSCLIRCMGNLIGSLKIAETDFVKFVLKMSTPLSSPHSNCQFLIIGKFGEATKISIFFKNQTCHLCNAQSIIYLVTCTPETADLN